MPIILSAPAKRKNARKAALPPMRNNGAAGSVVIYDASGRAVSRSKNLAGIIRHARNRLVSSINVSPSGVLSIRWEDGTHVDTPFADPSVAVSWAQSREWLKETPVTRKNGRKTALPPMRNNGEFYAQPYEQYAAYMYSVGKQPMVAWEWAEKQQEYYAKKAKRAEQRSAKASEAAAKRSAKASETAAKRAAKASASAAREQAHAAVRAAGIPQGLREAIEQTGVPRNGVTLAVTPEGAVVRGSYSTLSIGNVIGTLKAHGFTWLPNERAWLFLGFFDADHFRALEDALAAWNVDVRRVGFEASSAAEASRARHREAAARAEAARVAREAQGRAHAALRSGGLPQGLRETLAQAGVPANGVTLVVTPEGAVAQGGYNAMSQGGNDALKAHGFTWLPSDKVWAFLGFFDTAHFRSLADNLAARGIPVRRVGFNPRRKNARKAPARRNGSRSVVDPVAARELELYIENERNLVGPGNTMGANIMRMLAGRIVRGTYDSTKAWKAWSPLVTEGAKRYKREHGPLNASKATRDAVATRLSEAFEAEVRVGALDPMKLLGARNNRGTLSVAQGNQMPQTRRNTSSAVPPLSAWEKGDYAYIGKGRGMLQGQQLVIENFSPVGSAWVAYTRSPSRPGHISVARADDMGTGFYGTSEDGLQREYSRFSHATPGAARAALVKASRWYGSRR